MMFDVLKSDINGIGMKRPVEVDIQSVDIAPICEVSLFSRLVNYPLDNLANSVISQR